MAPLLDMKFVFCVMKEQQLKESMARHVGLGHTGHRDGQLSCIKQTVDKCVTINCV